MLIITCIILAFICAWFGVAFVDMTSYYSIFGNLKYKILKKYFDYEENEVANSIINDHNLPAWEISDKINQDVYWYAAKRYKLIYLSMCPYCLATWFYFFGLIFTYLFLIEFSLILFPIYLIIGLSFIWFFLNFVNKK